MTVLDFYRIMNHDEVLYLNIIDNKTKENFANISDDYVLGEYNEDYLFGLKIESIGIEEDSTNINLYVIKKE